MTVRDKAGHWNRESRGHELDGKTVRNYRLCRKELPFAWRYFVMMFRMDALPSKFSAPQNFRPKSRCSEFAYSLTPRNDKMVDSAFINGFANLLIISTLRARIFNLLVNTAMQSSRKFSALV
jgi:hypothetical protein